MAATPVELLAPSGLTLTLELYPIGTDVIANTGGDTLTESTNAKGRYTATVDESISGDHVAVVKSGSNVIANGYLDLSDDTTTYRVADSLADARVNKATLQTLDDIENLSAAAVNAEVVDALATDTYAEPGQEAPGATVSLSTKISYLYKAFRNKITNDGSTIKLYADDTTTVDQKATVSDVAGTVTRDEFATGP